ncbi:MAG: aminotransferase class IV, partial [Pirellulales bacterium]|nr:aminotransferase class IV [Pirellulales bacterium]
MPTPFAYFSGSWLPENELAIPLDDAGFLLGASVVERLRTFAGQVFRVDDHLDRLRRSLGIVGWEAEPLCAEVAQAIQDFLKHNSAQFAAGDDWGIVCLVTPGSARTTTSPTVCVHGRPLPFSEWGQNYQHGIRAGIVATRQ